MINPRPRQERDLRLASNIRTFLLALVLGTAVWVSAVSSADPNEVRSYPKSIPIEIVGQDPSLVLTNELPTNMDITIRAPRSVWDSLTSQDNAVRAILDLSGLGAGEHTVPVKVQVTPRLTQVVAQNPKTVTVDLESLSTKTLPLTLALNGQPAAGYQAGDATLNTKETTITGPTSLVKEAMRAQVTLSLDGVREAIDEPAQVQIINAKGDIMHGLTVNPETVQAKVPISQQGGFRDVAVKVVVEGQIAAGYRLENISVFPPVVTVLGANTTQVNSLPGVVETQPLNLQDAKQDISTRLALKLPKNITLVGAQTVQVQVSISPIQTSLTLQNQPINMNGLGTGLSAQVFPQTVDVIVSGPLPVLDKLASQDVKLSVNLTDLTPGTYQLKPEVEPLNGNVLVESILPGTVEVVISIQGTPTITPTATPGP
jgi:YbbR domain-containing protein